jgi:hypothetical protein
MLLRRWFLTAFSLGILSAVTVLAQAVRYEIPFPNLPGTEVTICDLHMHTVFSDGSVWPRVRIDEAWRLGLHAISITDHVEYHPWKDDVRADNLDRSYELAAGPAREHGIVLIRGAEITRDTPPGHFNAVFLQQANDLAFLPQVAKEDMEGLLKAFEIAVQQGAFVFWNHPGWKGPELGKWGPVQEELLKRGWLHGIEICNGETYYREAHEYALEKNLTLIGTSDIHGPDLERRTTPTAHRTLTLVFPETRTPEAIRKALLEGKTLVWYQDMLIGREPILGQYFGQCLKVRPPHLRTQNRVFTVFENNSAVDIKLERSGKIGPASLTIPAGARVLVAVGTSQPKQPLTLEYVVTNWWIAPDTGLPVKIQLPGEE